MKTLAILLLALSLSATTLVEVWNSATSGEGYSKHLILNSGEVYTGGLVLDTFQGTGESTLIDGNGAILDLQGGKILVDGVEGKGFSVNNCVITNGGIVYKGLISGEQPIGVVEHVTFYKPLEYAIRAKWCGEGIVVRRSIFHSAVWNGGTGVEPDGINVAFSSLSGYGIPDLLDNWSYHTEEPQGNYSVHFTRL